MLHGKVEGIEYAFGVVLLPEIWEVPKEGPCTVQLVNPKFVYGRRHLLHCIVLSEHAFQKKKNIASTKSLELLIRLAGTRQIKDAIAKMRPEKKAILVVFGDNASRCYREVLKELKLREIDERFEKPGEKDAMERAALLDLG